MGEQGPKKTVNIRQQIYLTFLKRKRTEYNIE